MAGQDVKEITDLAFSLPRVPPTDPKILSYFLPLSSPRHSTSMNPKLNYMNGFHKKENNSFWKWKGISINKKKHEEKRLSVTGFLQDSGRKIEEAVAGPGGGIGIGCGVGVGFGLVGGVGYSGWPWNHLKMVFGIGMGCGVGVGVGYGQGIGLGFTLDSLESYLSKPNPDSNKRILIQI